MPSAACGAASVTGSPSRVRGEPGDTAGREGEDRTRGRHATQPEQSSQGWSVWGLQLFTPQGLEEVGVLPGDM